MSNPQGTILIKMFCYKNSLSIENNVENFFITKLKISQEVLKGLRFDSRCNKTNLSNIDKDTWD